MSNFIIKNISRKSLWLSATLVPPYGRTIKPGATIQLEKDPRTVTDTDLWPRPKTVFQQLLTKRLVEIVTEDATVPPPVDPPPVDTPPPGLDTAIGEGGHDDPVGAEGEAGVEERSVDTVQKPTVEEPVPTESVTPEEPVVKESVPVAEPSETERKPKGKKSKKRELPIIEPTVVYSTNTDQFTVDWATTEGILETDTFKVQVIDPSGSMTEVATHTDTTITYNATAGAGEYVFAVVLTDADKNTAEGVSVSRTVV